MATYKKCPHCGKDVFRALIKTPALVTVDTDGNYTVLNRTSKEVIEIIQCNNCKKELTEESLASKTCSVCGQIITHGDLDENGRCIACAAMEKNEELAKASKEEILRLFLESQRKNQASYSEVAENKVAKATAKAEAKVSVEVKAEEPKEEVKTEASEVAKEEPAKEEVTTPRKRKRKVTEAAPETVEEVTEDPSEETTSEDFMNAPEDVPPVETKQSEPVLEDTMEAPFPSTPELFEQTEGEAASQNFEMFPDEEEAF